MRNTIMFLVASFFSQFITAQEVIELWGDDTVGRTLAKEDPISKRSDEVTRLTEVTNPRLRAYKPAKDNDNGDVIIVCPGGGYNILAVDKEGDEVAEWLTTIGYTAYVLEYRVPKQRDGAFQDAQRALKMLRSQIPNTSKLGILGFSAGGHLAASATTRYNEQSYSAIDKSDEASAKPDFGVLIYPAYLDKGENESLSPEITLTPDTPPIFMFMTADDFYSGSSIAMAGALRKNKTPIEFHLYPEGGHGYGLRPGIEAAVTWPGLLEKWLKKQ